MVGYCEFKRTARSAFPLMNEDEKQIIFGHLQFKLRNQKDTIPSKPDFVIVDDVVQKEQDMSYNHASAAIQATSRSLEGESRDYFLGRIAETSNNKLLDAQKTFGLRNDESPKTARELIKRIKDGLFVLPLEKDDVKNVWLSAYDRITWRDPAIKEDHDGYNEYESKVFDHAQTARDAIMASVEPKDWHKAIQSFEKLSVH